MRGVGRGVVRGASTACTECPGFLMICPPAASGAAANGKTYAMARILVIGDEELFETMRDTLVAHGYAVDHAADGSDAARRHAETPADLVIAGPGCADGGELEALLGLIREHPGLKVVTVSEAGAEAYLEGHAAASALGALATISQPIEAKELLFHVLACLGPLD